jgi:hypothetical protein
MPNEPHEPSTGRKLIALATPLALLASSLSSAAAAQPSDVKERLARVRAAIAAQADQPSQATVLNRTFADGSPDPSKFGATTILDRSFNDGPPPPKAV